MPVVIKPDPDPQSGTNSDRSCSSPFSLLCQTSSRHSRYPILRSSFGDRRSTGGPPPSIVANKNGFAHTVIRVWQQDLHLRLRPDDVWLAILTQFSFFVNGNAEALRHIFVAHQGQEELLAKVDNTTIGRFNVGGVTQWLAARAKERLVDPDIATTLLPSFTTTTPHDRDVASMVFLGVVVEYFAASIRFGCSFPSVTLLGERDDWADILRRVAWFGTLGHEDTDGWTIRLTKVLEYMVASFDSPDAANVKDFWTRAVHEKKSGMSGGITTLSGWLTAFCWWEGSGERVKSYTDEELARKYVPGYRRLTLDGVEFPVIDRKEVPSGVVTVPVTLSPTESGKAIFLAGSMGMQVTEEEEGQTAAQPTSGWWLLTDRDPKERPPPRRKEKREDSTRDEARIMVRNEGPPRREEKTGDLTREEIQQIMRHDVRNRRRRGSPGQGGLSEGRKEGM